MKKSLIALAVAGAFAAPAFAATSNVDVYGVINMAIQDTNESGMDITVLSNTSRVGFKGSEDLGGGLKAVWQVESGISGNGDAIGGSNRGLGTRNTFVGLAGSFGTVLMGRHDTPYKISTGSLDPFSDTIADYNLGRLDLDLVDYTQDWRDGQALAYISPDMSGLTVAAALVMTNNETNGSGLDNGSAVDATSIAAMYSNGPLFATLAYQDVKVADSTFWKLGVGYTFGDAKVGFVYEDGNYGPWDRNSWILNGTYNMGPIALKAEYGDVNTDTGDGHMFALGADYSLSKRTTAYFVYGVVSNDWDSTDPKGWNLGVKHSF